MNENLNREKMLELLADQAIFGLSEQELKELELLENEFPELKGDDSFEFVAASIGLSNLKIEEPMPHNLQARLLNEADKIFDLSSSIKEDKSNLRVVNPIIQATEANTVQVETPKRPFWQWLTPIFAGIGCIALLANIWISFNKTQAPIVDNTNTPIQKHIEPSLSEKRQQFLASAKDLIKTSWDSPQKDENLKGEIVWSDSKQEGYMTFRGLAQNDANNEAYQLWIFDETQDEKTPVDGGVFDVDNNGEVIIPIDAKLKVKNPKMFAVTVEKPGGVVVSKREKIVALAKVEA